MTEHQAEAKICPNCKSRTVAPFPQSVVAPAYYGDNLKAYVAYLNKYLTKINHQKWYNANMRYINKLDEEMIKELEEVVKEDKRYKSRYRAQSILLSNQGKSVNELAEIFGCEIRTIYRWFDRFEAEKVKGVYELKGRGRKAILTIEKDEKKVKEYIKKN